VYFSSFFFSSRRRHTRFSRDWSSDVCSSDLFAVEGVTLPLEDKWALLPSEQDAIRIATDAYNETITAVAANKGLALVDFKSILRSEERRVGKECRYRVWTYH